MNDIAFIRNGEYDLPDLKLNEAEQTPLSKYGRMRKHFLREHRKPLYTMLCIRGTLFSHRAETDARTHEQLDRLIDHPARSAGVTEALKASDPIRRTQQMNAIKARAEEIILHNIVFK